MSDHQVDIQAIEQRVFDIISEQMGVDKKEITRDISFINELNIDSLDAVELVMEFEDAFGTSFTDEDAEKIQTVGEAINYIVNDFIAKGYTFNAAPALMLPDSKTSRITQINEIAKYFVSDPEIWKPADMNLLPKEKGIYGWYFDQLPPTIPVGDYFTTEGYKLLYIGIAGEDVDSKSNLRERIRTQHLNGNAYGSTLRKSLGSLLRGKLEIQPYKRKDGKGFTFGTSGEKLLTEWMISHARIAWVVDERPWEIESVVFSLYGTHLPLNIDENENNPFKTELENIRKSCRQDAK
jgi:acyl carrier protein